jgi:hypothetical protein
MKRTILLALLVVAVGATAAGAGSGRYRLRWPARERPAQPAPVHEHRTYCVGWVARSQKPEQPDPRPLVWILDGAGDLKGCSNALGAANIVAGFPVEIAVFPWSHGYRRLLRDQIDMEHAREQGERLAHAIAERKKQEPGRRVILIGHSAGCAVVLAACELLPMDSLDRVLLLAPSVSTEYDIRPTLWTAREGVDVFCSRKDWVALGFVVRVIGTTDNFWSGSAAGRWGFKPKGSNALAEIEQARLRQHHWSPDVTWTGHLGGHHGMHAPGFIHAYLMPLMAGK